MAAATSLADFDFRGADTMTFAMMLHFQQVTWTDCSQLNDPEKAYGSKDVLVCQLESVACVNGMEVIGGKEQVIPSESEYQTDTRTHIIKQAVFVLLQGTGNSTREKKKTHNR